MSTLLENYLNKLNEIGFEDLPKGWDKESVKKYAEELTDEFGVEPDEEDWFYKCVDKVEGEGFVDDPERFCAALKDEVLGKTKWRGKEHD